MLLTKRPANPYRSLSNHERIKPGDLIEDVRTGKRERVVKGYYTFLSGQRAGAARELPGVYDVVRHYVADF